MESVVDFIKSRWFLLMVLAVFVILKIPHLSYPYYWDECWPYAAAIRQMYEHGVSLSPIAIDVELSHGHPLLFHCMVALWMHVFGHSHFAMHSFALLVSLLLLVAVYEAGYRLFNKNTATIALLLVVTQVIFFVQSSFVLVEMSVALFTFLGIVFYARGQYLLSAISMTCLFFTKESGLVLGLVLGVDAVVGLFNNSVSIKERISRVLAVIVPAIMIGIFFLIQHHYRGWYVYPMHVDMMISDWGAFWYKFRMGCIRLMFYENLKFYTYLLLVIATIIAAIKSNKYALLVLLLPTAIIYYYVDDMRAGRILPSVPFFILFILSLVWLVISFIRKNIFQNPEERRIIYLIVTFVFAFLCFCTLNFFTYRYLLAALIPMLFLAAIFFDLMVRNSFKWMFYIVVAGISVVGYFTFKTNDNFGDSDLGAFKAMEVQQGVVNYLEQQNLYDKVISTSSFLETIHLINPTTGYLSSSKKFDKVVYDINGNSDYIIFDNIEPDKRYESLKNSPDLQLVYKINKGVIWAEIYKHKSLSIHEKSLFLE